MFVKIDINNIDYTIFDSIDLESFMIFNYPELYSLIKYNSNLYSIIGNFCNKLKDGGFIKCKSIIEFLQIKDLDKYYSNNIEYK